MSVELENINGETGGSGGGSSSKGNLFDVKTMAEAIANKGWAFTCKATRQDLAKADVPTLYADIKDKYDNADATIQLSEKASDVNYEYRNVVYVNGAYYTVYTGNGMGAESGIFKSTDGNSWTKVMDLGDPYGYPSDDAIYVYKNKIFFCWYNGQRFVVYDTETETGVKSNSSIIAGNNRRSNLFIYDNKLYFTAYNDSYKVYYVSLDELDADLTNKTYLGTTTQPIAYDGTYFYGTTTQGGTYRTLLKGTSIDNITTSVGDGYAGPFVQTTYEPNSTKFVISVANKLYQVDSGAITLVDCSSYFTSDIRFLYKAGDNELYASDDVSPYKIMHSKDNGTTWEQVFSDLSGIVVVSSANGIIFATGGSAHKLYKGTLTPQAKTDTYIINGNEVEIDYYTKDGFKICIADGGTNDTNLATVYSYLGYYNYYRLDTTNETVSLPRNSNLYSMMYVGDNYQDTLDGISGNATRLLPQAENINVTGATPTITISANKTYSFDTAITSLKISDVEVSALESVLYFTTGAGTISLSAPNTLKWGGGNEQPQLEPNTVYCIAIRNGLAEIDNFGSAS